MFIDGNQLKKDSRIKTDICIVGAGIAGIQLAVNHINSGVKIVLLEAGDTLSDKKTQEAHRFVTTGLFIDNESRITAYGGTSTVWHGVLCPLDPIDFEKRDWVPNSGWPFSREHLIPYYNKAAALLGLPRVSDFVIDKRSLRNLFLDSSFEPNIFYFMKKEHLDFGKRFKESLLKSPDITVFTNSHATSLETNENGKVVTGMKVQTLQGNKFKINARHVVLATGGIENARLLMLSKSKQHLRGLGNEYDQVGRYYMDHPKFKAGVLFLGKNTNISNLLGFDTPQGRCRIGIKLSEVTQRKHHLLNSYIQTVPQRKYRLLNSYIKTIPIFRRAWKFLYYKQKIKQVEIRNYMEQAPMGANRITLSKEKDAFGLPRASIHWSLSPLDKKTIIYIHKLINKTKNATGEHSFESPLLKGNYVWPVQDASHHMGTTRMGLDPKTSVTDANAKVHGIKNLYIAGSSLFPTSGYANPNYTIFALTQKLSDHLKKEYGISPSHFNQNWIKPKKKNVLLVGSGNRVKGTVLPALYSLRDEFHLIGVLSRTKKYLTQWYGNTPLSTETNFKKFDVSKADILYISVSINNVDSVLRKFNNHDVSHVTLILETPVNHLKDVRTLKHLKKFKKVVVAEDLIELRMYTEAKKLIDSGVIGNLKYINLMHYGALHHTIALLKFLSDSNSIIFIRKIARGVAEELRIRCGNGAYANLLWPRDYDNARYLFVGDQGTIADYPISKDNHICISVQKTPENGYAGIRIDGKPQDSTEEEELFNKYLPKYRLREVSIHEPLWMNQMKIHSLMRILRSACEPDGFKYSPINAYYDWLPRIFFKRFGFFLDIPIGSRTSVLKLLLKILLLKIFSQ